MAAAEFVAGDWGTSHLRLFLCDRDGGVLDSADGPGAADSAGRFETIFDSLVAQWGTATRDLPAVLCGMVGSSIGWIQAPYVACPANPEEIANACASLRGGRLHIVPGLSCRNRFDAPDVLRGEETQILGALELEPSLRQGRRLLCLPGTHTKWVVLEDGAVTEFLTSPTGELFTLLRDGSVLVRGSSRKTVSAASPAFQLGLSQIERFPRAQLLHRLFECRSRGLAGELAAQDGGAFLSGLLVANDIYGALDSLDGWGGRAVHLVGSENLTGLYAAGLSLKQCRTSSNDGAAAAIAGLVRIRRELTRGAVANAT